MQPFPHPVEALKFEIVIPLRHFQYGGNRMGIMGRELRIDMIRHRKKLFRAGEVTHIGRGFSSENRVSFISHDLGELDLRIPIRAFDKTHHDLAVQLFGERIEPVDHIGGTRAICLYNHPKAIPTLQIRI